MAANEMSFPTHITYTHHVHLELGLMIQWYRVIIKVFAVTMRLRTGHVRVVFASTGKARRRGKSRKEVISPSLCEILQNAS
jgi:hypothetical protein